MSTRTALYSGLCRVQLTEKNDKKFSKNDRFCFPLSFRLWWLFNRFLSLNATWRSLHDHFAAFACVSSANFLNDLRSNCRGSIFLSPLLFFRCLFCADCGEVSSEVRRCLWTDESGELTEWATCEFDGPVDRVSPAASKTWAITSINWLATHSVNCLYRYF